MLAKREHAQLAALDDHEDVKPILGPGPLPSRFPVLLATQHTLFRPRRSQQRQFLVRDADRGRVGLVTVEAPIFVFLGFTYDRVRQVGRETEGGSEERSHGVLHALDRG